MTAITFGILWAAYTGGLYGYCLIRGYDVSLPQLVNPVHPYKGPWPPPPATNTVILPSGSKSEIAAPSSSGSGGGAPSVSSGTTKPDKNGNCPPGNTFDPKTGNCIGPAAMLCPLNLR